jgi:nitroreductase
MDRAMRDPAPSSYPSEEDRTVTDRAEHGATSSSGDVQRTTLSVLDGLCTSRRSVRVYRSERIPREQLRALLDLATRAPSNFNRQPWHFVVADSPEWCTALNDLIKRALARVEQSDKADDLFHVLGHVKAWLYPLETSAAIVLAFYKPSPERLDEQLSSVLDSGDVTHYNPNLISLGMAIQNLLLAAHAFGLGACMHSGPLPFLRGAVNRLLKLPPNLQLAGLISLGFSAESPPVPAHRDLERVLTFLDGPLPERWRDACAAERPP